MNDAQCASDVGRRHEVPVCVSWLLGDVCCACRQSMSAEDACSKTLADYLKFDNEMSVVSVVWKECKRLVEAYNEQQVTMSAAALLSLCF